MKSLLITTLFLAFNYYSYGSIRSILLEAHSYDNHVSIKWTTKLTIKGGYFIIERSKDAKTWDEVMTMSSKGEPNQQVVYFEMDEEPIIGISYYRLKQVAYNGDINYSNVVPVQYKETVQVKGLFPFSNDRIQDDESVPNPFKGKIYFVILRDNSANEYYCKAYISEINGILYAEPVEAIIPEGSYLVTASNNDMLYSQHLSVGE